MPDEEMPHARDLVAGFLNAVAASFAFLHHTPDVAVSHRIVTIAAGSLRSVTPADMPDHFFAASVEFLSPSWSVQVTYGEREFAFNLLIASLEHDPPETYALWEWLRALELPPPESKSLANVTRLDGVAHAVHVLAFALESQWDAISSPSPEVLARVRANRKAWHAEQEQARREHERRATVAAAGEAFRRGDFARVVEMLEPVAGDLSESERARLAYARRRA